MNSISPTPTWSYQLQFNFKYKKSQKTPFLFTQKGWIFRHFDVDHHHICRTHKVIKCVAQDEAKTSSNNSKNSDSSSDGGLSDWFGSLDSSNGDGGPNKNGVGGILGVGLAGVLLFVGITSAAMSIGKRSNSRSVPEMKPIVEQQEVLPTSQEKIDDESNVQTDYHTETKPIIEDDLASSVGSVEYAGQTELVQDNHTEPLFTSENSAAIGLPLSDVNKSDTIASPDLTQIESVDGSFVTSSFVESQSSVVMSKPDDSLNVVGDNVEAGAGLLVTDYQQETLTVTQTDATYTGLESSSGDIVPIDSQNLESSSISRAALEADSMTIGDAPVVASVVNGEENKLQSALSFPIESISTLADEQKDGINAIDGGSVFESEASRNFMSRGIPAPSLLSTALQVSPGKILVPAVTVETQSQALAALKVLKVIESDAQPGDLCTRREYARWLVSASSALSRNLILKVYPAMYIENVTELAFDDITPEDPDFASIQGLAEAGLITSKLSKRDMLSSPDEDIGSLDFHPDSPLSRQDLVTWKMALEKRQLPEADQKVLRQISGFIDVDRIDPDACPALVADLSAAEQGIVALAFGYTRLFQPDKPVTKGQAAIALTTGEASDVVSEELARIEAESIAEKAVSAHNALVAEVEKDINASFEKELLMEREKIELVQKMAEEAKEEVEKLRAEREEKNIALVKERAAIESEMEVLSRMRHELEEQLQSVMSNKAEISYEKERIEKLRKETEEENQAIIRLQYELEVERKALSMARTWAEDEAKRVQEHAKALEEARDRWESKGLKVLVGEDLREEASDTLSSAGKNLSMENTVERAENLTDKLKLLAGEVGGKSREIINTIIQKIQSLISAIKEWISNAGKGTTEFRDVAVAKVGGSVQELQHNAAGFGTTVKESVEKLTQRFKT